MVSKKRKELLGKAFKADAAGHQPGAITGKVIPEAATEQQIEGVVSVFRESFAKMVISRGDMVQLLGDRDLLMVIAGKAIGEALATIHTKKHPEGI